MAHQVPPRLEVVYLAEIKNRAPDARSAMGVFSTTVSIGNLEGGDQAEVKALVDTGASDSMFPSSLLAHLHLRPRSQVGYVLADGGEVRYGRGQARICIGDRDGICPVIFFPEGEDNCLIGATTLQILMFSVDSTNETLVPTTRGRLGYGGSL